jgi:FkbM family methyltransferase
MSWQIGSRILKTPIIFPFVNTSRLIIKTGLTGATGNIYTGLHDFEDMSFVLHLLRSDDFFVDVGANIGSYTILAGAVIGARCISIEPIPSTFQSLLDNVNINRICDRVTALNIGIGYTDGQMSFTDTLDTFNHVATDDDLNITTTPIDIRQLDNVLASLDVSLIKIDVEGFETNVIAGADRTLSNKRTNAIIMEYGAGKRYGFDEADLHSTMLNYGFKPFKYLPFDRDLIALSDYNKSGNTIYVRDTDSVKKRIMNAPKYTVNGQML